MEEEFVNAMLKVDKELPGEITIARSFARYHQTMVQAIVKVIVKDNKIDDYAHGVETLAGVIIGRFEKASANEKPYWALYLPPNATSIPGVLWDELVATFDEAWELELDRLTEEEIEKILSEEMPNLTGEKAAIETAHELSAMQDD